MPRSGCSALHGVNSNKNKNKKKTLILVKVIQGIAKSWLQINVGASMNSRNHGFRNPEFGLSLLQ